MENSVFKLVRAGKNRMGFIVFTAMIVTFFVFEGNIRSDFDRFIFETRPFNVSLPVRVFLSSTEPKKKVILLWTKFFGQEYSEAQLDSLDFSVCPIKNCIFTADRRKINERSAVIFHIREGDLSASDLPANRQPSHLYVFYAYESPHNTGVDVRSKPWPGFFNLTWSYRRDSDIFGDLYVRDFKFTSWDESAMNAKRKLDRGVALISNCHTQSGRERYLDELNKYFPVDMFGACGNSTPCKRVIGSSCEKDLVQKYKFYFAFENSICKDYITEKAMRPLTYGSVPVVFGGGPYDRLLPPGSFINAEDYQTPKDLAEYLTFLSRNPNTYKRFFDWRANWAESRWLHDPQNSSICKLCQIVNDGNFSGRVYDDIDGWWNHEAHCRSWKN